MTDEKVASGGIPPKATRFHSTEPRSLLFISDPGQDLDDELTFIMLRHLVHMGMVNVCGIVTTLTPAFDRARLCRGTLDSLGLFDIPVGLGTDGGDKTGIHKASTFEKWAKSYMPLPHSERGSAFEPGRRLLHRVYCGAEARSLTLVVIASFKDCALFLRDHEELFAQKTREVVIMGGVEEWEKDGESKSSYMLVPDTAHNNMFDVDASKFFYRRCQELGVRLIVVSRWSAYAAKLPRSCYDELAALGSSIGCRLRNAQRASIESLWVRAAAPSGSPERRGLPDRCNRQWFLQTFCGGRDCQRGATDSIWDLVEGFVQYDTLATLAAFPALRARFFDPVLVPGIGGTTHLVIGRTEKDNNVSDATALSRYMIEGYTTGLALNHKEKKQFILVCQPRWNNRADVLLGLTMFRALYELGILGCAGVILSMGHLDEQSDALQKEVNDTLVQLGLGHIPVLLGQDSTGSTVSEHLNTLYNMAPPQGVTLVNTGAVGDLANFSDEHPKMFRERTQRVVLMSAAHVVQTAEGPELEPDPQAHNNSIDLPAAKRFFVNAQHLLVPMVVLSRHFAQVCNVPRSLIDDLGAHGALGSALCNVQRSSITQLWEAACAPPGKSEQRRGLADRCDRNWFVETFCPEGLKDSKDIWGSLKSFNVYSCLAVLAALPEVLSRFTKGTSIQVRSVEHFIIGRTKEDHGLRDNLSGIRGLIYQCLFTGTRLNASEFDLKLPRRTPLSSDGGYWEFDQRESALDWILPNPDIENQPRRFS